MKRLIILLMSVAFMIKMNAQTEIYVNIGLFPQGHIPSPTTELQTSTTALSSTESKQIINSYHTPNGHPAFTIGVLRPIIPNLSIGVQYSYFTSSAPPGAGSWRSWACAPWGIPWTTCPSGMRTGGSAIPSRTRPRTGPAACPPWWPLSPG